MLAAKSAFVCVLAFILQFCVYKKKISWGDLRVYKLPSNAFLRGKLQ